MPTPTSSTELRPWTPPLTNGGRSSRRGSLARNVQDSFIQSRPPVGMFAAFGSVGSSIPTLKDIQQGNFLADGWSGPAQRRNSQAHRETDAEVMQLYSQRSDFIAIAKEESRGGSTSEVNSTLEAANVQPSTPGDKSLNASSAPYSNGYQFPPKHTKQQATIIALKATWNFVTTPFGFLLAIYALNIIAWGGMLFLILCHATPAMAHPSYNDPNSSAKRWVEIDSQILNALFCVTGLGLIPWRFRDLYYLLKWRLRKDEDALRRLAGIHRGWFRLKGSQHIDVKFNPEVDNLPEGINESALALPRTRSPSAPLTGERAPPTKCWKLDFVIWVMVWNTFLQIALCGLMWGFNRFERPSSAVGLLIGLACIVASAGGYVMFMEGKRVKRVEGVPVSKEDMKILREMHEKESV